MMMMDAIAMAVMAAAAHITPPPCPPDFARFHVAMAHTWPGAGCIQATSRPQPVAWMQTAPPPMANMMPTKRLESGSSAGDDGSDSDGCGGGGGGDDDGGGGGGGDGDGSPHNLSTMPPGFRPLSRS
jgi:hypothetical protein